MSVDFDWSALDADLTSSCIDFLDSAFSSAPRPSFLGPIQVTSFSFGDAQPEVELLDITDVYKEFLEVDDEELLAPQEVERPAQAQGQHHTAAARGAGGRDSRRQSWNTDNGQQHQEQHFEGRASGSVPHNLDGLSGLNASQSKFSRRSSSVPQLHPSSALFSPGLGRSFHARGGPNSRSPSPSPFGDSAHPSDEQEPRPPSPALSSAPSQAPAPPPSSTPSPSLQLHLRVTYSGNLTIGLATSLLINYPSPMFMSLPLKLALTSLAFRGTFLIAFEGDRRRIHISLVDPREEEGYMGGFVGGQAGGTGSAGARLLSGAVVESEVGEADKHVLKNVGKVERFVLEVARSTLENELLFPNFQTILF